MKKTNKKSKQRILAGVALIVIVILIASSIFIYYEYFKEEEIKEEKPIEITIDDRISPLENQGLVFEVVRIRHRGLYDKLMTPGFSWKNKPTYYWVLEMDGLEYTSKDVEHLGGVEEIVINTWDTMFQENKILRDVEEEQETSNIKLTIFELIRSGIIFKRYNDIEREKIELTYDYRTGRWTGDDKFNDYDGYGHYLGNTFEVWFNIYQIDYDLDYIPYWTEVNVLGTDPRRDDTNKDPDGDGIPTFWEWKWGYDPFTWDDHEKLDPDIDGIENIEEFQMAKWLADPYTQDIYVEIDYMGRGGFLDPPHVIWEECQQAVLEKYAEHNIKMYFDMGWPDTPPNGGGSILPHYSGFSQDSGMILQYYKHYFPDERKGIFRYVVGGHSGSFNHPAQGNVYDAVHVGFNLKPGGLNYVKKFLFYQIPPTQRGIILTVASTMMHELGHTLGISPWTFEGCDNLSYLNLANRKKYSETWGNYYSVMNYFHMYKMDLLDYSDGRNGPPYDQNDWEKIFVPSFEYNAELIEEIFFEPPGLDKVVSGESEFGVTNYIYDEKLTEQFVDRIGDWSPVKPIEVNWAIFKLEDNNEYQSNRDFKVYVQPNDVPHAGYVLYGEGFLNSEGKIQFYSQQDIINDVISMIS